MKCLFSHSKTDTKIRCYFRANVAQYYNAEITIFKQKIKNLKQFTFEVISEPFL